MNRANTFLLLLNEQVVHFQRRWSDADIYKSTLPKTVALILLLQSRMSGATVELKFSLDLSSVVINELFLRIYCFYYILQLGETRGCIVFWISNFKMYKYQRLSRSKLCVILLITRWFYMKGTWQLDSLI